jgi:membrane-anchored protein YejM (alkaline phosphatase superfamily)
VQAINTGARYPIYGVGLKSPSIFQLVGEKYKMPVEKLWSIGHWHEFNCHYKDKKKYPCVFSSKTFELSPVVKKILSRQEKKFMRLGKEMLKTPARHWPLWESIHQSFHPIVNKIFSNFKPKIVHYVMGDVESAHYGTFGRYVHSLRNTDQRIYEIWSMIENDPYYKDNTFLIVTSDHSRDDYYMEHDHPAERVWTYMYGPGIKAGVVIDRLIHHVDIFATIAHLMNVMPQNQKGEVLDDCFRAPHNEKERVV